MPGTALLSDITPGSRTIMPVADSFRSTSSRNNTPFASLLRSNLTYTFPVPRCDLPPNHDAGESRGHETFSALSRLCRLQSSISEPPRPNVGSQMAKSTAMSMGLIRSAPSARDFFLNVLQIVDGLAQVVYDGVEILPFFVGLVQLYEFLDIIFFALKRDKSSYQFSPQFVDDFYFLRRRGQAALPTCNERSGLLVRQIGSPALRPLQLTQKIG